jgi:hypothetical protein
MFLCVETIFSRVQRSGRPLWFTSKIVNRQAIHAVHWRRIEQRERHYGQKGTFNCRFGTTCPQSIEASIPARLTADTIQFLCTFTALNFRLFFFQ